MPGRHIAIIMDGNGRWAKKRGKKRIYGHRQGLETLIDIVEACREIGISILTVYAFSTENWNRSDDEVSGLMNLFIHFYKKKLDIIQKNNVKVIHSGSMKELPKNVRNTLNKLIKETSKNNDNILNIAINYGGRQEILNAVNSIIKEKVFKNTDNDIIIKEEDFQEKLFHPEIPDPDLIIRTSGEKRISNFLLWQAAYSELYFTDVLWPDFSAKDLAKAIAEFQNRERRFGKDE